MLVAIVDKLDVTLELRLQRLVPEAQGLLIVAVAVEGLGLVFQILLIPHL